MTPLIALCLIPVAILDTVTALRQDRLEWVLFLALMSFGLLPILILRGRFYMLRATLLVGGCFIVALLTLLTTGLIGSGRIYAIVFAISVALFLPGRRAIWLMLAICAVLLAILGAQSLGWWALAPATLGRAAEPGMIIINLLLVLITIGFVTLVIISLISRLTASLQDTQAALVERDRLNEQLEDLVAERTNDLECQLRYAEALASCSRVLLGRSGTADDHVSRLKQALEIARSVVGGDRISIVQYLQHGAGHQAAANAYPLATAEADDLYPIRPVTTEELRDLPAELDPRRPGAGYNGAVVGRYSEHPQYQRYLDENGILALLIQPLVIDGVPWGYLNVIDHQRKTKWEPAAVRMLRTIAEMIVAASVARQAHQTLYERESLLRTISDTLPSGMLYQVIQQSDGSYERFTYISRGVEALFGITPEALISNPKLLRAQVISEDREWLVEAELRALHTFTTFDVEARFMKIDGRIGWFHFRAMPQMRLPEGRVLWNGVGMEISTRKETELALAASQSRLRVLGDNLPNGFIYQYRHDSQRRPSFTYLSSGVERMWGVAANAALSDAHTIYRTMVHEDLVRIYAAELRSREELTVFTEEVRHRMPNGELRWAHLSSKPRRDSDGSVIWDGIAIDITERKQASETLLQAKEAAEAADRAKSTFLAHMSHEIRTPLNAVIGMAELLSATELSEQQRGYLDTIVTAGHSLLAVINQILDFSRIEAGQIFLEVQPFDLRTCLEDALHLVSHYAERKGLTLSSRVADDLAVMVLGDGMRLRQVILNLLANAIKFTEQGSVTLKVTAQGGELRRRLLTIVVEDTGIGMSVEEQERIFHPFVQADDSTARRYGGTGLGLAICRQLVSLMGGTIRVDSTVGVGSTFVIVMPIQVLAPAAETPVQPSEAEGLDAALQVLVVEDNLFNQEVARELLARLGHTITVLSDGAQAVAALQEQDYDVVLMDVQMPVMDGEEATRHIQALGTAIRQPYIIALTASALSGDRERLLAIGMDDYLSKPVHFQHLQQLLAKAAQAVKSEPFPQLAAPVPLVAELPVPPAPSNDADLIDWDALSQFLEALGPSSAEVFEFTVELFAREVPPQIATLVEAVQQDNRSLIQSSAHRLRGGCLQLGAHGLAGICRDLELSAAKAESAALLHLAVALEDCFQETLVRFQAYQSGDLNLNR